LQTNDGNKQQVTLNGHNVKLFHAYKYNAESNAYIHVGQFEAPAKVDDENLENYIGK